MINIGIIIGSTRPGRNSVAVAKWVYEIASKRNDATFEIVDIKDYDLSLIHIWGSLTIVSSNVFW